MKKPRFLTFSSNNLIQFSKNQILQIFHLFYQKLYHWLWIRPKRAREIVYAFFFFALIFPWRTDVPSEVFTILDIKIAPCKKYQVKYLLHMAYLSEAYWSRWMSSKVLKNLSNFEVSKFTVYLKLFFSHLKISIKSRFVKSGIIN